MNMVEEMVWVPSCCVCQQVRDDRQKMEEPTRSGLEQWMSLRSFLRLHRIPRDAYKLTHTYCPQCMEQFLEQLRLDRRPKECESSSLQVLSA